MLSTIGVLAATVVLGEPPAAFPGAGAPVTDVTPAAPIIDVRARFVDQDLGIDGYEIIDGAYSDISRRNRERLGAGDDAPAVIYVRVFDGTFAIDPFEPVRQYVPRPVHSFAHVPGADSPDTLAVQRQIFGELSLQTNRALFNWDRVEATAELFSRLEEARGRWLRENGYYRVRTFTAPNAEQRVTKSLPEPRAIFRKPADQPRTLPREEVRRDEVAPDAAQVARAMASGDEPVRISKPGFDARVARVSKPGQRQDRIASR